MDGSSSMERRKQEHKKIILLGFITCNTLHCEALRMNIFEGGYYDMTPNESIHAVKCICNSGQSNKGATCAMCE